MPVDSRPSPLPHLSTHMYTRPRLLQRISFKQGNATHTFRICGSSSEHRWGGVVQPMSLSMHAAQHALQVHSRPTLNLTSNTPHCSRHRDQNCAHLHLRGADAGAGGRRCALPGEAERREAWRWGRWDQAQTAPAHATECSVSFLPSCCTSHALNHPPAPQILTTEDVMDNGLTVDRHTFGEMPTDEFEADDSSSADAGQPAEGNDTDAGVSQAGRRLQQPTPGSNSTTTSDPTLPVNSPQPVQWNGGPPCIKCRRWSTNLCGLNICVSCNFGRFCSLIVPIETISVADMISSSALICECWGATRRKKHGRLAAAPQKWPHRMPAAPLLCRSPRHS